MRTVKSGWAPEHGDEQEFRKRIDLLIVGRPYRESDVIAFVNHVCNLPTKLISLRTDKKWIEALDAFCETGSINGRA